MHSSPARFMLWTIVVLVSILEISSFFQFDFRKNGSDENGFRRNLKFLLYTGSDASEYITIDFNKLRGIYLLPEFQRHKGITLYIGGFQQKIDQSETVAVLNAYLQQSRYNVIQLKWQDYNTPEIGRPRAVEYLKQIGPLVATELNKLFKNGFSSRNLQLAGHSLGAQMCGFIGRNLINSAGTIVGLDASGPSFDADQPHLTYRDADFVINLHTDVGGIGTNLTDVSVNYFANGGRPPQPGCESGSASDQNFCSHLRAPHLWASIITNSELFFARFYPSYEDYERQENGGEIISITPDRRDVFGEYYFNTTGQEPFGLGIKGVSV